MMEDEHPFAPFIRILGKGKKGSRSLTLDEAEQAMAMILDQQVRPEQLGAFLMLLRVKEESPAELAGFVRAVQQRLSVSDKLRSELDWSIYSGKKRQLPWHFLTALVLAGQGVRVCLHGARGHTPGRIYVEDLLGLFGLKAAQNWRDAASDLRDNSICYLPLGLMNAELARIINLRSVLGLRSPVHTLSRLLNPLRAPFRIDGVFHPAYGPIHQQTARLLGQHNSVTVRGDGGEAEIRPDADCTLQWLRDGEYHEELWPRALPQRQLRPEQLDPGELLEVWRGQLEHPYGEAAVVETLAICLRLLGRQPTNAQARQQAQRWWQQRDKACY